MGAFGHDLAAVRLLAALIVFPFRLLRLLLWGVFRALGHPATLALGILAIIYAVHNGPYDPSPIFTIVVWSVVLAVVNRFCAWVASALAPPRRRKRMQRKPETVAPSLVQRVARRFSAPGEREMVRRLAPELQSLLKETP